MNPSAIVFWAFLAGIGYLINDTDGAVVGLLVGLGMSLLADML